MIRASNNERITGPFGGIPYHYTIPHYTWEKGEEKMDSFLLYNNTKTMGEGVFPLFCDIEGIKRTFEWPNKGKIQ